MTTNSLITPSTQQSHQERKWKGQDLKAREKEGKYENKNMNRVQARSHAMKRSRRPQRDPIFCQIPMSRTRTLKVPAFSWAAFSGDFCCWVHCIGHFFFSFLIFGSWLFSLPLQAMDYWVVIRNREMVWHDVGEIVRWQRSTRLGFNLCLLFVSADITFVDAFSARWMLLCRGT